MQLLRPTAEAVGGAAWDAIRHYNHCGTAYFRAGLGAALTAADPAGLTPPTGVAAGLAGCLAGPLEGLAAALTGTAGALPPTGAA